MRNGRILQQAVRVLGVLVASGVVTKEYCIISVKIFDEQLFWRSLVVLSASEAFFSFVIFCFLLRFYLSRLSCGGVAQVAGTGGASAQESPV
jgi:hypothetical protein